MRWRRGCLVLMLGSAGCDGAGAPSSAPAGGAAATAAPTAETTPADAPLADEMVDREVTWPAAERLDRPARASLPPAAAAKLPEAPVPVLVPNRPELLAGVVLMTKPRWYAVSTHADGLTVSVHASRRGHRYIHLDPQRGTRALRGGFGFVGQNRGIWSVSWVENGVAYALDVECASLPDPRCGDPTFVVELVEGLAYVGGQGAEEVRP